ncbi:MAG: NADH:flavin oxidoreductase [Bacteriovorax sp.]|nr:NADH:flavin oxidoreductase [Bacteriovorax sp.]
MKTLLNKSSSFHFKNDLSAINRIVVPAMASQTATASGYVTEKTLKHYANLSNSGAGIVFVEYTYVHPTGKSEDNQLGIFDDQQISGLSKLSKVISEGGALAGIQLTHAGGKTTREQTGGALMGPSAIAVPVKDQSMEIPTSMNQSEIELWKSSFLSSAKRASLAGFSIIELHSAHGYGLNQWISPLTNQRTDNYGGSFLGRLKLLTEIIELIQVELPEILLSVRIPGRDFLEAGLSQEGTIEIAKYLEKIGVDIINVSSGIGGWRRPADRAGQGYLIPEAKAIQQNIGIPVIGVGGIETGQFIDEIIGNGNISFAAVGRAILNNPELWKEKNIA